MPVNRMWTNRKGTSLVEILVVMVVLLVGIMTIIQMFPTGFRVVRAAESQTIATRLGQQEIERWKSMADNLPTGILPIDEAYNVLNPQAPGPPFVGITEPTTGQFVRGNALNVRQIVGETTLIPRGSTFYTGAGAQDGAKYVLAFGPIDATTGPTGLVQGIVIKGGDLRRRIGDYTEAPPRLRAGDYAVDYTLVSSSGGYVFHVAFPKAYGVTSRDYYISYSYLASTDPGNPAVEPDLFSKLDQPVLNVAGGNGDWVPVSVDTSLLPADYSLVELEPGSDTCARGFRQVPVWSEDPYEFRLADAIVGVVAFNPTGHDRFEYAGQGLKPLQARIDYRIKDLRIIREDKVVPEPRGNAETIPIKLALRFILNMGDPTDNPDEVTYNGLVPAGGGGGLSIPLPLLVIDLATGLRVDVGTTTNDIDFKAGVVKLPIEADLVTYASTPLTTVPLAGRHLRFYYRADGDWSVQCNKAYLSYTRKWGGNPDYRHYVVKPDDDAPANAPPRLLPRLFFAPCEGLKSVVVDYTYITESDGVEHKTVGEAHKIDVPNDVSGDGWCIDLDLPEDRPDAYIPTNGRIIVVGTSFTVRVIWRDGKAWRFVEMGTNLTRS